MFLRQKNTKHLVEVLSVEALFDPFKSEISGRLNIGEEMPEANSFAKADLMFPSGEALPRCWVDPDYREDELKR